MKLKGLNIFEKQTKHVLSKLQEKKPKHIVHLIKCNAFEYRKNNNFYFHFFRIPFFGEKFYEKEND